MDLGNYRRAMDIAPWWPAAYWALAISSELSGNRAEAIRNFINFLAVMELAGLEKPYREWMIETYQMRYQVSKLEANFLVEAGFLSSRWKSGMSGGRLSDIAQVFEKVDPELWRLAGEAMRNAMRFKTLHVSKDGRGDYSRIQDAIDSLERDGGAGRILVAPGTYREKVTLTDSARIVIQATERGRSFVEGPRNSSALHIRGGGRIVIDGLVITGFGQETAVVEGTGQITIKYTDFKGDTRMGLRVSDSNDVYVWRCSVKSSGSSLIIERSNEIEWAEGKTTSGTSNWGIDIVSSRALLDHGDFNAGDGGILTRGSTKGSSNVTIIQSTIRSATGFGITLLGPSHLSLQRNVIRENQEGAIYSRGGKLVAKNNKITGNGKSGVVLQGGGSATLIDNIFAEEGIALEASEGVRLLASNNTVYGGETGFQISNAYTTLTGNRLQNPSKIGIYLINPHKGWSIDNNTITGSEIGILVEINNDSVMAKPVCNRKESCIISKNLIFENTNGVVTVGPQGGMIWLKQNTIVKNSQTGVLVSPDGPSVFIDRNILAFNGGGILDPNGLVTINKSVGFGNQHWDDYPDIQRQGKLLRANPRFRNIAKQDFRPHRSFMYGVGAFTE